jgi:hypothetical protein
MNGHMARHKRAGGDTANRRRRRQFRADRLARAFAYQMLVLDELDRLGCKVKFTDAPRIDDDPQARLLT